MNVPNGSSDAFKPTCETLILDKLPENGVMMRGDTNLTAGIPRTTTSYTEVIASLPKKVNLQLLTTRALPQYTPRSSPIPFGDGGYETYSCPACEDTFVLKSSLCSHLQRKSVLIRFKCDSCPSIQVFYNRCSLLSHIQAHCDKEEKSDILKAVVLPLPLVLIEGMHTEVVQTLLAEVESESVLPIKTELPASSDMLQVSVSEVDDKLESNVEQQENADKVKSYRCSECDSNFATSEERMDHFVNKDTLPAILSSCTKCGVLCPSECSTKAHKRLHLQVSPYVCPECGDNPDRYWENFQRHLIYHCFHFARLFGFRCTLCSELLPSLDKLKEHTTDNHIEILYKCQMCPMAFTSFTNFQVHKRKNHSLEMLSSTLCDPLQMYKCVTCDVVFLGKEDCNTHCDSHLKENVCRYVFQCSECKQVHETKTTLRDHIREEHVEMYRKNIDLLKQEEEVVETEERMNGLNTSKTECLLCHGTFMTRHGHSVHVTKSHSNHKYPCGVCGRTSMNRMAMISHGKDHLRENVALCLLCQNKPMETETLDLHLLYHVERIKFQTYCPICEASLLTFSEALHHLRAEHLLKPTTIEMLQKAQLNANLKREKIRTPTPREAGCRSVAFQEPATNVPNIGGPSTTVQKGCLHSTRLKTGENVCCKCDFKSSEREEFKKHLLIHKERKASFQCQECGLCFVVEPSLKRHLKIVHKVQNIEQYLAEEGSNYSPENETVLEVNKSNDLECTVCFEVFTSEVLLKTHMRSHGMAFIQAKINSST